MVPGKVESMAIAGTTDLIERDDGLRMRERGKGPCCAE